jgi:ATP-dependent DNA ligase
MAKKITRREALSDVLLASFAAASVPLGMPKAEVEAWEQHQNEKRVARSSDSGFISPMLASKPKNGLGISDYSPNDYLLEEKFDGHRIILDVAEGNIRAWSRVGNPRTLPAHLLDSIRRELPPVVKLDSELFIPGGTSTDVTALDKQHLLQMVFFDVLAVDGTSTLALRGTERRSLLEFATSKIGGVNLQLAEQYDPSEAKLHELWNRDGEGGVLKLRTTQYHEGMRSSAWVKLKNGGNAVLRVTGFVEGLNGPHSVIVGVDEADGKSEARVKTLNTDWLRKFRLHGPDYIGARLQIHFQLRTREGAFRHPMADKFLREGEEMS